MLSIDLKITGDQEVQRKLRKLGDGINDLSDSMRQIGQSAISYYSTDSFAYRGRNFGAAWTGYATATQLARDNRKSKAFARQGNTLLIKSGSMQSGFFAKADRSSVIIDNHAPYYKYHQSSAARKSSFKTPGAHGLPRRQMAGVNNDIKTIVKSIIRQDVMNKLKRI